jgi:hypothetical protein
MKKPISAKKIAANKANALRSTGAKSELGKTKSKANATKHGVYATSTLLAGEDGDLYQAIRREQRNIFDPQTYVEKALVDQLVNELWTLRRITKAEYFYLAQVQAVMKDEIKSSLSYSEKQFLHDATIVEDKSAPSIDHISFGFSVPTAAQKDLLAKLEAKLQAKPLPLSAVYELAFVFDSTGRAQRLAALKRHSLQTILSIERELEKRLRLRNIA